MKVKKEEGLGAVKETGNLYVGKLLNLYRVFGRHYRKQWKLIGIALFGMIASTGTSLLVPWPFAWIIDYILKDIPLPPAFTFLETWAGDERYLLLAPAALSVIALALVHAGLGYVHRYYVAAASHSLVADVRERVFHHLQRLSLSFQTDWRSGDIVLRMTNDLKDLKGVLVEIPVKVLSWTLTISTITGFLFFTDWGLAFAAWAFVPPLYWVAMRFGSGVNKATRVKKEKESEVATVVSENLAAMALVQAYGREDVEKSRFGEQNVASLKAEVGAIGLQKIFKRVADVIVAIGTACVIYRGALLVVEGALNPGILVVFAHYLKKFYSPVDKLAGVMVKLAKAQISGERVRELVESEMVVADSADAQTFEGVRGLVEFKDVNFGYRHGGPVLRSINFTAEPGETIALVGTSGAGKSTLLSLLLRFYDPTTGSVHIDGLDLRDATLKSLRSHITIVFQEPMLMRRTIRQNIEFGRDGATEEDIINAAKLAEAHEFIEALPKSYDTLVMERGGNLSGGQQQRISIARAILRDSPIVVLDEPTTGLDAVSESKVNEAISHLSHARTTFVIAHRFSSLRNADKILVLERGEITAQGTHRELLESSALYKKLFELQFEGDESQGIAGRQPEPEGAS